MSPPSGCVLVLDGHRGTSWSIMVKKVSMVSKASARVVSDGGRKAVCLENGVIRAVIDSQGGMMPQFGLSRGTGLVNAHWIPTFRANSGKPWDENAHGAFWKGKLLYNLAGDFPCAPNFGPDCRVDGVALPAHGWTADREWSLLDCDEIEKGIAARARFALGPVDPAFPLSFRKTDIVIAGQPAYFSIMDIRNAGPRPLTINVGRHNTLGSPFLQAGCRISLSARRFLAAPAGTEFDPTGRLAQGVEFSDLAKAPLRDGGFADISLVPGMIGYTDFVTGAIPAELALGWSCVVNPVLRLAYLCFFPGAAGLAGGEIALSFNDLWMQYGGRNFTPWSMGEGEADLSFCLGTENVAGAFANGLAFARDCPMLLGRPTLVEIPAGSERRLSYGTALLPLEGELLDEGICAVEAGKGELVLKGKRHSARFPVDADFMTARAFT